MPPTFLSSLNTIKHRYPSEDPPPCSPQPTHCSLTRTSISVRQEKEREREGWRKGWTEIFERSKNISGRRRNLATDTGIQRYPLWSFEVFMAYVCADELWNERKQFRLWMMASNINKSVEIFRLSV